MNDDQSPEGATLLDATSPTRSDAPARSESGPEPGARRRPFDLSGLLADPDADDPRERTRELGRPVAAPVAVPVRGRFGPFLIEGPLAEGGMARLFRARNADGRPCVLKTVRADIPNATALFRRELQLAPRLDHPHVVRALDAGTVDGTDYVALEWIDGPSLRAVIDAGRELPLELVREVARDVARALAYVHALTDDAGRPLELIHRDVSPENILLSSDGRALLADFGIAWFQGREDPTRVGVLRGKPRYMAPEQHDGRAVDARADLWALGRVIEELLGERAPPPPLDALLTALLAPQPEHRPPHAGVVQALLEHPRTDGAIAAFLSQPALDRDMAASMSGENSGALLSTVVDVAPPRAVRPVSMSGSVTHTALVEPAASVPQPASEPARWWVAAALLTAAGALVLAVLVLAGVV